MYMRLGKQQIGDSRGLGFQPVWDIMLISCKFRMEANVQETGLPASRE